MYMMQKTNKKYDLIKKHKQKTKQKLFNSMK